MSEDHIVTSFDNDMSELESLFEEMGSIVLSQLKDATRALRKEDHNLAKKVVKGDKQLNELERELNDLAIKILALRQPFALDLRYVLTTLKSAGYFERMGDLTRNMAQRTRTIAKAEAEIGPIETLIRMSELVQGMTEDILKAHKSRDSELAKIVREQDEKVDMAHNSLFRELLTYMMEDTSNISACMHVLFIAKNIERMGDNVADIAQEIIYMTTGDWPDSKRIKGDKTSKIILS